MVAANTTAKRAACIDAYRRLKNLKLAGAELGIPWQTVYVHLRAANEPVTGDKARYGSDTDRLAARAEAYFQSLVPDAEDMNRHRFQAKFDYSVFGHKVDVKSARFLRGGWAFSLKKQSRGADFFVCIGFDSDGVEILQHAVIPGELIRHYATIRLKEDGKWWPYRLSQSDLVEFMRDLQTFQPHGAQAA